VQKSKRKLLFSVTKKDFILQPFKASGAGGQHRNKVETAMRIIHKESGAVGQSSEERSQSQNKRIAFRRLVEHKKFKTWMKLKAAAVECGMYEIERMIEVAVEDAMKEENLKIEVFENGRWIEQ